MMTKTELLELIRNGESSFVELKRDDIDSRALAKELVAFSNFEGGTLSREADTAELQRLFQRRGSVRFETQPVTGSSIADLSRPRLTEYFATIRSQVLPENDDADGWERLLHNTEILAASGADGGRACSVAGLLLFGASHKRFLPHATIDIAVFPGTEKEYNANFRDTANSPLVRLCNEQGDIVSPGMVDQALSMLQPHLSTEMLEGAVRTRKWDYPKAALREALVNAVVHRDYLLSATSIEVSVYADRMEVISPGKPPNKINPDRMRAGCRAARNQLLKDVLRDYG
ncbi:MAG: ATP-binding protein [Kiritimatiellae bacterium]|nr:ATP-binding protein [Kiritimatiellia bacterium]